MTAGVRAGALRRRSRIGFFVSVALVATLGVAVPETAIAAMPQTLALNHAGSPAPGQPAAVSTFTPGFIIADQNFYSHDAMTEAQIQAFLDARVGTCESNDCLNVLRTDLASYPSFTSQTTGKLVCSAVTGGTGLRASTIIYRVQQACGLSARVILVTLQKEQGLVTSKNPSNYALSYAMGWACPDSTGCVDPNSQFAYQVYRGSRQLVTYKLANFSRQPGVHQIPYSPSPGCGATNVTIVNYATAALYNYTPYQPTAASLAAWPLAATPYSACNSYGNRNFWFYYNQWFGNPTAVVPGATSAPTVGVNDGLTLELTWAPPAQPGTAPVSGYYVEFKRSSATTWSRVAGEPVPDARYVFVGPSLGVAFDFRVRAVNRFGIGAPSPTVSATTPAAPSAPRSLTVAANDGAQLRLEWAAPETSGAFPVSDYVLQYKRSTSTSWITVNDGVSTTTSFTFVKPSAGVTFDFRVQARNAAGAGAFTAPVQAKVPGPEPTAPQSLAVALNDGAQLRLAWAAPAFAGTSPVSDYILQYKRSTSTTWTTVKDGVSTATSFTFVKPSSGVTFDFRVQARNAAGVSAFTVPVRATVPGPQPSAPQSLRVAVNDGAQLRLEWLSPAASGASPVTDYVIQYKRATSTTWTTVNDAVSTVTSFTFVKPSAGVTFDFRVAARNASGTGAFSGSERATTPSAE